jgi:zinc D-Ala-D-Ala carboxypeptidase
MDIARHFTLDELKHSNTAQANGINNDPGPAEVEALRALCAAVLDPLRDALGKPISINCAYRGPVLNKRVGGVSNSQHLTGQAADIQAPAVPVLDLFKLIIKQGLPFDQVIYEAKSATSKWVHVSHVNGHNRGEIRVAKFGPDGKAASYPVVSKEAALVMSEPLTRSGVAVMTYEEVGDEPDQEAPALAVVRSRKVALKKTAEKPVVTKRVLTKHVVAKKVAAKKSSQAKPSRAKARPG